MSVAESPASRMGIELPADWPPLPDFAGSVAGDVRDPYPVFAEKRRDEPVERRAMLLYGDSLEDPNAIVQEAYWIYRYDDVNAAFRDNATFTSESIKELMGLVMGPKVMVGLDEPEHRRHRQLVAHAFRQKTLGLWEAERVQPVADDVIGRFADRGYAELVSELTFRLPVQVIANILGIPLEDQTNFHQWAMGLINVASDPDAGFAASESLATYFRDICDERRAHPRDDVISDLVTAEQDGERLDEEEILSFLRLLLPAGAETTFRSTGNFLYGLFQHPDQLDALRNDRSLFPQAIEEAVRWEPPLLITSRRCVRDTEVAGVTIPAGANVVLGTGSANHDETRWGPTAEAFDIFRPSQPHIAFGAGVHMCLGIHLARLEMRATVETLFDRLPNLRWDAETAADLDSHIHGELFRSPTSLPVRWDP